MDNFTNNNAPYPEGTNFDNVNSTHADNGAQGAGTQSTSSQAQGTTNQGTANQGASNSGFYTSPQNGSQNQNGSYSGYSSNHQNSNPYSRSSSSYGYSTSPNPSQSFGDGSSQRRTYDASGTSPSYGNPQYGNNSYRPFSNSDSAASKRKKNNTGKIVFAVIVCICIVVASIGIGGALFSNTPSPSGNDISVAENHGSAATPGVEKSPVSASEYSGSGSMTAEQVYEAVKDINVGVVVYSNNQKAGEGSGIIVGADDTDTYTYILTAAHVISSNYSVIVKFNDETEVNADIVGYDTKTDVGVLKVKKTGFKAAIFGDSSKLAVGQTVYAIGNPGGSQFFGTFTDGKVTAIDRPVSTSSSSAYDLPCIQHNAAINPGNSGGALINEFGQVIGLNSSKIADTDYEGMGFSVPINTALSIYNDIVSHGYVTNRPMLGITYYAVSADYTYSAIAWKNNLPYGSVVIKTINQNSDLANKNVQSGDIITAVNGTSLDSTDILLDAIERSKVGDTLTLSICRLNNNGSVNSTFDVKVSLVEDKGDNIVQEEQTTENPFSSYFPFGY